MFRRRKKQPVHHRVSNLIWPRIGVRRSVAYVWHRIARLHGTPHTIAVGLACGAAISFTPFVGFHLVLAALMAWLLRGSIVAGLLGTAVGNPWTFPFIWLWIYEIGTGMGAGKAARVEPDFIAVLTDLPGFAVKAAVGFDVDAVYLDNAYAVLWPMFVGSIPTFCLVWLASYLVSKPVVATYQARRIARRRRKQKKARDALAAKTVELALLDGGMAKPEPPRRDDVAVKESNG